MADAGSKIPRIPVKSGIKRPSDNTESVMEKRRKVSSTKGLQKCCSVTNLNKQEKFTEASKRAIFQPPRTLGNITNMRESMPVTRMSSISTAALPVKKSKRPAWDLKGRVQDMESVNSSLQRELLSFTQRLAALEQEKSKLHHDVEVKSAQSEEASVKIHALENELGEVQKKLKNASEQLHETISELNCLKIENIRLETELKSCLSNLATSQLLVANLRAELNATKSQLANSEEENENLKKLDVSNKSKIQSLEQRLREAETERRKMHNIIQELKGNIRVFCRIRPPLPEETSMGWQVAHINRKDNRTVELCRLNETTNIDGCSKSRASYEFSFDHIFGHSATQDDVFHEISQLVQSALDGYNVCIFAYGQTGSGKTYTMEGPEDIKDFVLSSEDTRLGIIPRSVQQIFSTASLLTEKGWKYDMETSFMEIYNENIRDLLADSNQTHLKCEIKKSACKGNDGYVSNVKTVPVTSTKEVFSLLRKARHNRAVAFTNSNEYSSRSHYIFQMKLSGENCITGEKSEGLLNLVDLAGSERIKESGSQGDRLTEAKNINKSLSNLGNVIMALSQKADHIPYRNSKLTHLLMNSLGGNSKTLMFVNISPWEENFSETVNSLRFATKVNQCNIGTAQRKTK